MDFKIGNIGIQLLLIGIFMYINSILYAVAESQAWIIFQLPMLRTLNF